MSRYFTQYWKNSTWSRGRDKWVDGDLLKHTAGGMFTKRGVEVGDTVYCITVINGTLYLAGKMIAEHICDGTQAAKYLGCRAEELWEAPEHIVANEATPKRFDLAVPLTVTEGLRFVSGKSSKPLEFVSPGQLDVQTLRGLRELEPSSALELDALLPSMRTLAQSEKHTFAEDDITKLKGNRKPRKCSRCGSKRIANIMYGMPGFSDELQRDIELGKIILGGCVITDDDPVWECVDCGKTFSRVNA